MGLKIIEFHSIMHQADAILNFGVPMEVDTGSNESAHKSEKTAAKLTQKCKERFDIQTAKRLEEVYLLDLAMEEMRGNKMWNYFDEKESFCAIDEDFPLQDCGDSVFSQKNAQMPMTTPWY